MKNLLVIQFDVESMQHRFGGGWFYNALRVEYIYKRDWYMYIHVDGKYLCAQ